MLIALAGCVIGGVGLAGVGGSQTGSPQRLVFTETGKLGVPYILGKGADAIYLTVKSVRQSVYFDASPTPLLAGRGRRFLVLTLVLENPQRAVVDLGGRGTVGGLGICGTSNLSGMFGTDWTGDLYDPVRMAPISRKLSPGKRVEAVAVTTIRADGSVGEFSIQLADFTEDPDVVDRELTLNYAVGDQVEWMDRQFAAADRSTAEDDVRPEGDGPHAFGPWAVTKLPQEPFQDDLGEEGLLVHWRFENRSRATLEIRESSFEVCLLADDGTVLTRQFGPSGIRRPLPVASGKSAEDLWFALPIRQRDRVKSLSLTLLPSGRRLVFPANLP